MTTQNPRADRSHALAWAKPLLKVAVAGALIYWIVSRGSLDFSVIGKLVHPGFILVSFGLTLFNIATNNYRWMLLMRAQGFETSNRETLPLTFIGLFFNFAMPGGVGGDVIKGYYLVQDHVTRRLAAATSIIMDRLIGLFSMILFSIVAILVDPSIVTRSPHLKTLSVSIIGVFLAFCLFFGVALSRRVKRWAVLDRAFSLLPGGNLLRRFFDVLHSYRNSIKTLLVALGLSVISQASALMVFVVSGEAMGFSLPLSIYFMCVPLGLIATSLPIAPAGLGVGQAVFLFLFTWASGQESPLGPNLITVNQAILFVFGLVGAVVYFARKRPSLAEEL